MSYSRIVCLVKMFFLFFYRNILCFGMLRSKIFRVLAGTVMVGLVALVAVVMTLFFHNVDSSLQQTSIVLDTYCCSVIMLTFVVFVFMKVLFMKKGIFLNITQQMPVTRRELNISMLIYEVVITISAIVILSTSMSVAVLIDSGMKLFTRVICNIVFTSITAYFILEFLFVCLTALIRFFRLDKIKNILLLCTMATLLYNVYIVFLPTMLQEILFAYTDNEGTSPYATYSFIADKIGFLGAAGVFFVICAILASLILMLQTDMYERQNTYIQIFKRMGRVSVLGAYIKAFRRHVDVYSYFIIAMYIYVVLKGQDVQMAWCTILLLTFGGTYAYNQSEELRGILMQKKYSVWRDYVYLISSQLVYISVFSIPILAIEVATGTTIWKILLMYLSILASVIVFTTIGIMFPSKQENPFSAFIGTVIIILWLVCIIVAYILINKEVALYIMLAASIVLAIRLAVVGMDKLLKIKRCSCNNS